MMGRRKQAGEVLLTDELLLFLVEHEIGPLLDTMFGGEKYHGALTECVPFVLPWVNGVVTHMAVVER